MELLAFLRLIEVDSCVLRFYGWDPDSHKPSLTGFNKHTDEKSHKNG
jgi:hypothetical protein